MAYADFDYYVGEYLSGRTPNIPSEEFDFFGKKAEREINLRTFNKIRSNEALLTNDVKECACAITEFLYEAEMAASSAAKAGLAGPLVSWSNDGESGSVDIEHSCYTESGKKAKIQELIYLYLGHTGLLYAGV